MAVPGGVDAVTRDPDPPFAEFARNLSLIWRAAAAAAEEKRQDAWAQATDKPPTADRPRMPRPTRPEPGDLPAEAPLAYELREASSTLQAARVLIGDYRAFLDEKGLRNEFRAWRQRRAAGE